MSTTPNDPAQLLASLFKGGQSMFGSAALTKETGAGADPQGASPADPMSGFMAFTEQMTQMQRQFIDQMTGFWTGLAAAGTPTESSAPNARAASAAKTASATEKAESAVPPKAKDTDKRFAAEVW